MPGYGKKTFSIFCWGQFCEGTERCDFALHSCFWVSPYAHCEFYIKANQDPFAGRKTSCLAQTPSGIDFPTRGSCVVNIPLVTCKNMFTIT